MPAGTARLRGALGASRAVERMASFGSTAPAAVAEQIAGWRRRLGAAASRSTPSSSPWQPSAARIRRLRGSARCGGHRRARPAGGRGANRRAAARSAAAGGRRFARRRRRAPRRPNCSTRRSARPTSRPRRRRASGSGRFAAAVDAAGDGRLDAARRPGRRDRRGGARPAGAGARRRGSRPCGKVVAAIREAARLRRRDPARLARAAAGARQRIGRASGARRPRNSAGPAHDALPVLVPLLQSADPADERPRQAARDLVARLGADARQPLRRMARLGRRRPLAGRDRGARRERRRRHRRPSSSPRRSWPMRRRPPGRRRCGCSPGDRSVAALPRSRRRRDGRGAGAGRAARPRALARRPARGAITCCSSRCRDPAAAAAAFGGSVTGTVERLVWNAQAAAVRPAADAAARGRGPATRCTWPAIWRRSAPAIPAAVNLVLLARLEALLVRRRAIAAGHSAAGSAGGARRPRRLRRPRRAADVLDLAVERGMWEAAGGAWRRRSRRRRAPARRGAAACRRAARRWCGRSPCPTPALQFAAARTLALAARRSALPGLEPRGRRARSMPPRRPASIGSSWPIPTRRWSRSWPRACRGSATSRSASSTGREAIFAARAQRRHGARAPRRPARATPSASRPCSSSSSRGSATCRRCSSWSIRSTTTAAAASSRS